MRLGIEENADDFPDVIQVVTRHGQRRSLLDRLRDEHPTTKLHHQQHDDRLLDVFTEAEAFAWAVEVEKLGSASWVMKQGAPDIRTDSGLWIEAKTIHRSAQEEEWRRRAIAAEPGLILRGATEPASPHPGMIKKFQSGLDDAIKKWERQDTGQLVVFFDWLGIDFGTSRREAPQQVNLWARTAEEGRSVRVVICRSYQWRAPVYP